MNENLKGRSTNMEICLLRARISHVSYGTVLKIEVNLARKYLFVELKYVHTNYSYAIITGTSLQGEIHRSPAVCYK